MAHKISEVLIVLSVLLVFLSVDCSKIGELQQATCYMYVLRLRSTLLKLSIEFVVGLCVVSDVASGLTGAATQHVTHPV